ncbi:hypothetical protein N9018_04825, partial [Rhodopirellula sp.]|nr:hypothetical protein [Rhodopirellula sp.]
MSAARKDKQEDLIQRHPAPDSASHTKKPVITGIMQLRALAGAIHPLFAQMVYLIPKTRTPTDLWAHGASISNP